MEEVKWLRPRITVEPPAVEMPPTEDELPCDDGVPMETPRHRQQMNLLIETLEIYWADRQDVYVGGNMFLYYNVNQVRNRDFIGPDFFAVQGVERREHKSWVIWQEGKGPDVVIELLSESTADYDKTEKKQLYQDRVRVPEYFLYDPFSGELAGFSLRDGQYTPIEPDAEGRLMSRQLGLMLLRAEGVFQREQAIWLRWATPDGVIIPTHQEQAEQAQQRAEQEHQRAEQEHERAEQERQRAAEMEDLLARYRERFGDMPE